MLLRLLLLMTVVPAIELYLLMQLADLMGIFETVFLILITGSVGATLAKREGLGVLNQLRADLKKGLPPADRLVEGPSGAHRRYSAHYARRADRPGRLQPHLPLHAALAGASGEDLGRRSLQVPDPRWRRTDGRRDALPVRPAACSGAGVPAAGKGTAQGL